jgi:HlyD family secretion protein
MNTHSRTCRLFRIIILTILLASVTVLTSCGNGDGDAEVEGQVLTPVEVYTVQIMDLSRQLEYSGALEASEDVMVSAETSGRVSYIAVNEGAEASAGETIIKLDDTSALLGYQAASAALDGARASLAIAEDPLREGQIAQLESGLDAAEAQFAVAESGYERSKTLFEAGAISQAELDAAELGYEAALAGRDNARQALDLALEGSREEELAAAGSAVNASRAQVGLASDMLAKTSITSPINGTISDVFFDPGELIGPGVPVFRVINADSLSLQIGLGDRDIPNVSSGLGVDITVDAFPGVVLHGVVTRVGIVSDPMTGTFPVEITVYNDDGELRAGMVARAVIFLEEALDGIVVPLYAVQRLEDIDTVYVEENGIAVRREIEIGLVVEDLASVTSGLEVGDRLIVRGADYIEDQEEINVVGEWESLER